MNNSLNAVAAWAGYCTPPVMVVGVDAYYLAIERGGVPVNDGVAVIGGRVVVITAWHYLNHVAEFTGEYLDRLLKLAGDSAAPLQGMAAFVAGVEAMDWLDSL